jgi:hypothetical protein
MDFLVGIDAIEDDELVEFAPPGWPTSACSRAHRCASERSYLACGTGQ